MECAPIRAQVWLDLHEDDLGRLPVEAAAALVRRAGLHARIVPYASGGTSEEQHGDRVNLRLTPAGEIGAVDAG